VWLLAVLLPLHAAAAGALAVCGPLHIHRAPTIVVLEDVRRTSAPAVVSVRHVALPIGHFHAGVPVRHQHARDDASVVALDDGGSAAVDGDGALAAAALAASAALPATRFVWSAMAPHDVRAIRAAWTPRTHDPAPPERPPRNG
jgi:hypothetical protein